MALWICRGCTAAYSVGAPACPQCGSTDHVEDSNMPKISKGGGASYEPGAEPEYTPDQGPVTEAAAPAVQTTEPETKQADAEPETPPPAPGK